MPAYFSIKLECGKKNLYPELVQDFCDCLTRNGCRFLGGYWGYEEDSLADIAAWNQRKLEENLEPGVRETYLYSVLLLFYSASLRRIISAIICAVFSTPNRPVLILAS